MGLLRLRLFLGLGVGDEDEYSNRNRQAAYQNCSHRRFSSESGGIRLRTPQNTYLTVVRFQVRTVFWLGTVAKLVGQPFLLHISDQETGTQAPRRVSADEIRDALSGGEYRAFEV